MRNNRIITVGRQFGSNGRAIAKRLAGQLGIKFYDRDLIEMAAERSNIHLDRVDSVDEKPANRWLYAIPGEPINPGYTGMLPINDILFEAQCDLIKELADKEDCIFVGRCADYILRDYPLCRNIFIFAPIEERTKTIMNRLSLGEKESRNLIKRTDKQRKYYYNYYTDRHWGELSNYQIAFDSSVFGIDKTADILCAMYKAMK